MRTGVALSEALCVLGVARMLIVFVPFRRIAAALGPTATASPTQIPAQDAARAQRVRDVLRYACRVLPGRPSCLVKSVAAMYLLRRRGLEGTLYLGVAANPEQRLRAHAWVRCGRDFVVGGRDHEQFTQVTSFARKAC